MGVIRLIFGVLLLLLGSALGATAIVSTPAGVFAGIAISACLFVLILE